MHLTIPLYPRRLSLITLFYGIAVFIWLTPEDSVWLVSLIGAGLAIILSAHAVFKVAAGLTLRMRAWFPLGVLLGAGIGAGTVVMTIVLMLMKTSVHNHVYPDYSFGVMSGIAQRFIAWTLAGTLAGLAGVLLLSIRLERGHLEQARDDQGSNRVDPVDGGNSPEDNRGDADGNSPGGSADLS